MDNWIAHRLDQFSPPVVPQVLRKARQLESQGKRLTYLLRGEPDFATPDYINRAAIEAIQTGFTHYPPTQGIPELRQAISDRMRRDFGLAVNPDNEILVTSGATMGLFAAVMAVVNPGDEVIMFDPVYDPYPSLVRMAGGVPVQVPTHVVGGHFFASSFDVEKAITQKTKAILINNPWNPTGSVMTRDELQGLVDLAAANDLLLIVDEIYEMIVFDNRAHINLASLSRKAQRRTITINSFSKTYAMTGWRLGYNIAPAPLTKAMLKIAEQFSRSAASFVQKAGVAALNETQEATAKMGAEYTKRRWLITQRLTQAGFSSFFPPEGTFFLFLDIRPFGKDSQSMSDYLLQHAGVVTVPGSAYGKSGEGFVRISFAYNEETLEKGIGATIQALLRM